MRSYRVSREPDRSDDQSAASDKVLEANDLRTHRAIAGRSERLGVSEEKYGPDARLLADDMTGCWPTSKVKTCP